MKLLTCKEVALEVDCHEQTVRVNAFRHDIGRKFGDRWMFTAGDMRKLKRVIQPTAGNPNFITRAGGC